jgi:RES domain-containing protein
MFALLLRDGSRTEIEAADFWEAMRAALRLDAVQLEVPGDPPRLMSAEQVRQELALDRPGLFDPYAPDWQPPSAAEFRELLRVADLSASKAGMLVGVDARKIRKWAGDEKADMPYAVWRLLSIYAGLAVPARHSLNEITK